MAHAADGKFETQKFKTMSNLLKVLGVVVFFFGALQQVNLNPDSANTASDCCRLVSPECDDDPIIVRGHVVNLSAAPISGASVKLKQGGVVKHQTTTNGSGEYCMDGVEEGNYVMQLSAEHYVTKNINLSISSETVRTDTLIAE